MGLLSPDRRELWGFLLGRSGRNNSAGGQKWQNGNKVWDTMAFWQTEPTQEGSEVMQTEQYVVTDEDALGEEEDIYGV